MPADYDQASVAEMAEKPISGLEGDVERSDVATKLLEQALADRKQRHGQRAFLFRLVMVLVPGSLVATALMMGFLLLRGEVGDSVYVAFISAMAVQSFALVATIARSLYREDPGSAKGSGPSPQ